MQSARFAAFERARRRRRRLKAGVSKKQQDARKVIVLLRALPRLLCFPQHAAAAAAAAVVFPCISGGGGAWRGKTKVTQATPLAPFKPKRAGRRQLALGLMRRETEKGAAALRAATQRSAWSGERRKRNRNSNISDGAARPKCVARAGQSRQGHKQRPTF